jgi:hypothetical protein
MRLSGSFGSEKPGPPVPPEMLAGVPLGEGETQGLVFWVDFIQLPALHASIL